MIVTLLHGSYFVCGLLDLSLLLPLLFSCCFRNIHESSGFSEVLWCHGGSSMDLSRRRPELVALVSFWYSLFAVKTVLGFNTTSDDVLCCLRGSSISGLFDRFRASSPYFSLNLWTDCKLNSGRSPCVWLPNSVSRSSSVSSCMLSAGAPGSRLTPGTCHFNLGSSYSPSMESSSSSTSDLFIMFPPNLWVLVMRVRMQCPL